MAGLSRPVGRPNIITRADIVRVGCDLGMARLRVKAVATALGVSNAALYRHVKNRWELERLVGEQLLSGLQVADETHHDATTHLVSFAVALRAFVIANAGLASYMLVLFPRGESSARILREEVAALVRRGYSTDVAVAIIGAVARLTLSLVSADEQRRAANDDPGFLSEHEAAHQILDGQGPLGPAYELRWTLTDDEYFAILIRTVVQGFVSAVPAGTPLGDVVGELRRERRR